MVTIRFARGGSKKRPFYRIVVTDSRQPRDGRYIERLGYYNPMPRGQDVAVELNQERIKYWLSQGAQTSAAVGSLIKKSAKVVAATPNTSTHQPEEVA